MTKKTGSAKSKGISHVGIDNRPGMVDVGSKPMTRRSATARSEVVFPENAAVLLQQTAFATKKGPIIESAIIAGTMAVKKTHELIPFCHSLPLDSIVFSCNFVTTERMRIDCTVTAEAKTGVEMEALTGASIAALTVIDMCKSLSLGIAIESIRVLSKSGGERNFPMLANSAALPSLRGKV